ncbi:MAG: sigma 54-interacting transcriptional regulator [Planctomycetes bacterium]|nr:sigma 54-interacting transcriptional regulator [Planctomycetota bacterium]
MSMPQPERPEPRPPLSDLDVDAALRVILEGTATETGEGFFRALVKSLAEALHTHGAWVTEWFPETRRLRALAFWMNGAWLEGYDTPVDGTPCADVVNRKDLVHIPESLGRLYPRDSEIDDVGAVSYLGMPLLDASGTVLGHIAVMDRRPMPPDARVKTIFRIFAGRAAAELRRLKAEDDVREREEKLGRLVDSAMDAIVELDHKLNILRANPAAEKVFACNARELVGRYLGVLLSDESRAKLATLAEDLDGRPVGQRFLWIPGGLHAKRADGNEIPAEATLSRYEIDRKAFHTLILRNVNERLEAEKQIASLKVETEILKLELDDFGGGGSIIGRSIPWLHVVNDVQQVAGTDATVLVLGETGTGKELVARAIHQAGKRKEKPFVKVNCASIPGTLIESEFFGHEQGAFTGATRKRHGRFALADGGTIFLDEVGELPLDLQAKLLRVLQEGEFEPVGSSRTQRVDVRVIAATNRDLEKEAREGRFREDLFYRLNVFPVRLPPLRQRDIDIVLLAEHFAKHFTQRMGRTLEPFTDADRRRLMAYAWPGNVRELENVIERGVITAQNGRLNLNRALPDASGSSAAAISASASEALKAAAMPSTPAASAAAPAPSGAAPIMNMQDMEDLERQNIRRALEACDWKVAGKGGAAELLGTKASTLTSRIKTLNIRKNS